MAKGSILDGFRGLGVVPDMWKTVSDAQAEQMRAAMADVNSLLGAQNAQNVHSLMQGSFPPNPPPTPPTGATTSTVTLANRAKELFLKRMGGIRAEMIIVPGDYVSCHVYGDMVFLFYCFAGREGCAKEHIDLFPSDTFVTQFRMILA
jgi:hypothetical protein